ncbi:hypothetical protein BJ742DRAFT_742660 [Cladochytrium replicatum]|nr:hypothetical protein BJ742DRAFT_742660 [Cladochytrium replicatum]
MGLRRYLAIKQLYTTSRTPQHAQARAPHGPIVKNPNENQSFSNLNVDRAPRTTRHSRGFATPSFDSGYIRPASLLDVAGMDRPAWSCTTNVNASPSKNIQFPPDNDYSDHELRDGFINVHFRIRPGDPLTVMDGLYRVMIRKSNTSITHTYTYIFTAQRQISRHGRSAHRQRHLRIFRGYHSAFVAISGFMAHGVLLRVVCLRTDTRATFYIFVGAEMYEWDGAYWNALNADTVITIRSLT